MLDDAYLLTFGELLMALHLWRSPQRFDASIEPAIITEWLRLMRRYATTQGRSLSEGEVAGAMTWIDPTRDVSEVRIRVLQMMSRQTIHCVWSGDRLSEQHLDIDHCFPWSAWPCDHLWNLLPANRRSGGGSNSRGLPHAGVRPSSRHSRARRCPLASARTLSVGTSIAHATNTKGHPLDGL